MGIRYDAKFVENIEDIEGMLASGNSKQNLVNVQEQIGTAMMAIRFCL